MSHHLLIELWMFSRSVSNVSSVGCSFWLLVDNGLEICRKNVHRKLLWPETQPAVFLRIVVLDRFPFLFENEVALIFPSQSLVVIDTLNVGGAFESAATHNLMSVICSSELRLINCDRWRFCHHSLL